MSAVSFAPPLEPVIIAAVGEPRSGKSTLIKALIRYWAQAKYFKWILVITGSKFNGDFDFIKNDAAVWDGYDEERFKKFFDKLKKRAEILKKTGKKLPKSIIVLDDVMGTLSNSDWFKSTVTRFRHYNVTLIIAAQYAAESKGCSTIFKACVDIAFMFPSLMANQVAAMHRSWGGWYKNEDDFKALIMDVMQVDHRCLIYLKGKKSIDQAYLKFLCTPAPKDFAVTF